jgi:sugar (pentulose or hexulose) kinase
MSTLVIAIFDIGKTNKKFFLFDEGYRIVFEKNASFQAVRDEDGEPCEDLQLLKDFVLLTLQEALVMKEFEIKAVNISAYGASLVYVDEHGHPLTPLYDYLKKYPPSLSATFYSNFGGEENLALQTASPALGSLNAGLQLYRVKYEKPDIFRRMKYALHLPQYLSYLISKVPVSDITSIGCHTHLWDFQARRYHAWIRAEKMETKLAPLVTSATTHSVSFQGKKLIAGIGVHDSSAALVPYLKCTKEPFLLISTGTWSISLNPFNQTPLTTEELRQDSLCYLSHEGRPVKAARFFLGPAHAALLDSLSADYGMPPDNYATVKFEASWAEQLFSGPGPLKGPSSYEKDYHRSVFELAKKQFTSSKIVLKESPAGKIFVDGGFSRNNIFMQVLARFFKGTAVHAANIPQASAIGAAMVIHDHWNSRDLPFPLIGLNEVKL